MRCGTVKRVRLGGDAVLLSMKVWSSDPVGSPLGDLPVVQNIRRVKHNLRTLGQTHFNTATSGKLFHPVSRGFGKNDGGGSSDATFTRQTALGSVNCGGLHEKCVVI